MIRAGRFLVAVLVCAVAVGVACVPSAAVAQANDQPVSAVQTLNATAEAVIKAYWTEERMRTARPIPMSQVTETLGATPGTLVSHETAGPSGPMVMSRMPVASAGRGRAERRSRARSSLFDPRR
jgi:hypothetical protein